MAKFKIPIIFLLIGLFIFLNQVFSGSLILSQTLSLGPVTLHYYGIIMALAVASGFYLAVKDSEGYGMAKKQVEDILFWTIIGGFIGARLYHVLSSFEYYQHNAIDIFKVWNGGLSIYGALIGGLATLFLYRLFDKDALWQPKGIFVLLDWLTPSLILGQIIGRFGNMFNYEAFGYPTNLPWKMFVPTGFRPDEYLDVNFFHPWFLYEQLGLAAIFLIIRWIKKANRSENNNLFLYYLLLYNIVRFTLEYLRIDSVFMYSFRQNALVSFCLIILSTALLLGRKHAQVPQNNQRNFRT